MRKSPPPSFPSSAISRSSGRWPTGPPTPLRGAWVVCSPETVGQFTAVGYFFARDLQQKLGVPIGLINATWGGTAIESWMSEAALKSDPAFAVVDERWSQGAGRLAGQSGGL